VRSRTDKGVVAVLDPRLATKGYRWTIINALPPMMRTRDKTEAIDFLRNAINGR
jgi:ATP-dependent DNA helicase DinG